jgi:SAM-dependent methyltransferase
MTVAIIYTALVGNNEDLFTNILKLYVPEGSWVADVTYGKGRFWNKVDKTKYHLVATDIETGTDLRHLPHSGKSFDAVVLDPPYAHSSSTPIKPSIADTYNLNIISGRANIRALYVEGVKEARRVLKDGGILIVKCQDEIESGKQHWNHIDIMAQTDALGFEALDFFILVQQGRPAQRHPYQIHARKNHSYFWVFRKLPSTIFSSRSISKARDDGGTAMGRRGDREQGATPQVSVGEP